MKDYKSLMQKSTERRIDTVIKIGAKIAEACLRSSLMFNVLHSADESVRATGIRPRKRDI
jgi:hypothetical protein